MDNKQVVYVTKYALTDGIAEKPLVRVHENGGYASIKMSEALHSSGQVFCKCDWHYTREDAVARAEEMRKAKIASHERSIAKLRKLSFS